MFEPVEFNYNGKQYVVESDRIWNLIAAIEEHVTFTGLAKRMSLGDVQRVNVSKAYASALAVAGCRVGWEEIATELGTIDLVDQAGVLLKILSLAEKPEEVDIGESPGKQKAGPKSKRQRKQLSSSG
jgi:hypothetical protein